MPFSSRLIVFFLFVTLLSTPSAAQSPEIAPGTASQPPSNTASVPPMIRISGTIATAQGTIGVTFALYKDQTGGVPLWLETQSVAVDANGRYTIYLGANHTQGLPLEMFASGEARWLGVQPAGEAELPRTLLVSVPYALSAGNAERLGGLPLSAFVFAGQKNGIGEDGLNYVNTSAVANAAVALAAATTGAIPKFADGSGTLTNSAITDYNGFIGIGTNSPGRVLHIKSPNPDIRLEDTHFVNSFWELQQSAYVDDWFGFLRYEDAGSGMNAVPAKSLIISNTGNFGFGIGNAYANMTEKVNIGPGNLRLWGTAGSDGIIFPDGTKQTTAGGNGGGGGVTSFKGRTGAVVPVAGDYFFEQIDGTATLAQLPATVLTSTASYSNPAWLTALDGAKITGTVTNGVYTTGSYANPAWITSLAASKIAGAVPEATHAVNADAATAAATATLAAAVTNGVYTTGSYVNPSWLTSLDAGKISGTLTKPQLPASGVYTDQANTFTAGKQDMSSAASTLPVKAVLSAATPTTCVARKELLLKTDASAGQQLFICNATGDGWILLGDGAAGGVTSFNGRTGAITPTSGDYSFAQISGTISSGALSGTYTAAVAFNNSGNSFAGNGAGLTNLNATNLTSGTIPASVLPASIPLTNKPLNAFTGALSISTSVNPTNGALRVENTNANSGQHMGVYAIDNNGVGVYGGSANSIGLWGSGNTGVKGDSATGHGVDASSTATNGVGLWAEVNSVAGIAGVFNNTSTGGGKVLSARVAGVEKVAVWGSGALTGGYEWGNTPVCTSIVGMSGYAGAIYCGGVAGSSAYSGAAGVGGSNSAGGNGVVGESSSTTSGNGVYGINSASGPNSAGVHGSSEVANGIGVLGEADTDFGSYGVLGRSTASNGNGVVGEANTGSAAYAIWGKSTSGYAGFFSGNVYVSGTLSGAAKQFKIDHPLDPANKYLYHTSVESPDMKNIYDGVAVLDDIGEAWVTLPEWFEALNRDFRYQLTAIGAPFNAYIAEEITNNRFRIAGGLPGKKVSWQVTGIRQDAWANAHRIAVEEDKPDAERGSYLHPDLFDQPVEKSLEQMLKPQAKPGAPRVQTQVMQRSGKLEAVPAR